MKGGCKNCQVRGPRFCSDECKRLYRLRSNWHKQPDEIDISPVHGHVSKITSISDRTLYDYEGN